MNNLLDDVYMLLLQADWTPHTFVKSDDYLLDDVYTILLQADWTLHTFVKSDDYFWSYIFRCNEKLKRA